MRDRWENSPSPMHQRFIRQMRGHWGWFAACTKPSKMPISMNLPFRSCLTSSHNTLACKSGIIGVSLRRLATIVQDARPAGQPKAGQ